MEKQHDKSPGNGQAQIEDLPVNQDRAEDVKAGYIVKLEDILIAGYQSGGHA